MLGTSVRHGGRGKSIVFGTPSPTFSVGESKESNPYRVGRASPRGSSHSPPLASLRRKSSANSSGKGRSLYGVARSPSRQSRVPSVVEAVLRAAAILTKHRVG